MKKTLILLLSASLLMTACNFSSSKNNKKDDIPDQYADYKNRDWYGIGLEQHTTESGKNYYYDTLIEFDATRKGKYNYITEYENNNFSLYFCDNGDFVNKRNVNSKYFDVSEYVIYTVNGDEMKRYEIENISPANAPAKYNFYRELVTNFDQYNYSSLVFEDTQFTSMQNVATSVGVQIKDKSLGTFISDDPSACFCNHAKGVGASFDEGYLMNRYLNYNPSFKYVGLPSVFSKDKVTSWSILRGTALVRDVNYLIDDTTKVNLDGYTKEQIRSWRAQFEAAGYETTSTSDQLDSTDSPSFTYRARVNLLKYGYADSSTDNYLRQSIKITCQPSKTNANEFSVAFELNAPSPTSWEGTFAFQDKGLIFYYTSDNIQYNPTIVNTNGELVTSSVTKGGRSFRFSFPNA